MAQGRLAQEAGRCCCGPLQLTAPAAARPKALYMRIRTSTLMIMTAVRQAPLEKITCSRELTKHTSAKGNEKLLQSENRRTFLTQKIR